MYIVDARKEVSFSCYLDINLNLSEFEAWHKFQKKYVAVPKEVNSKTTLKQLYCRKDRWKSYHEEETIF